MEQIRAFVGHSFTQDDEQVVQKVLQFLTTVSQTLPNFVWEHANKIEAQLREFGVQRLDVGVNVPEHGKRLGAAP